MFFKKVTKEHISSGIFGGSRSLMGIDPLILGSGLKGGDIFNFSFTILHSPYGDRYLDFIRGKLKNIQGEVFFF